MTGRYSRREALRIGGVAAAGTMLVACGAATEDEAAPAEVSGDEAMEGESEVMMDSGHQSPMLAQRVAAGELPSLDERLPLNPQIVQPWSEIGEYGGMFTVGNPAAGTFHSGRTGVGQEGVMRIGTDLVSVTPNIVESYEINAAGTELTLNLRKGMKWSDGHPHSADDFEFWYVDRVSNEELNARPPGWLAPGGALMDFQKIDDHTVKFIFGSPYPFILKYLSHYNGTGVVTPKHYCQQFHPAYADADTLNSLAVDAGFDDWTGRYGNLADLDEGIPEHNPDLPTLGPYKLLEKTQTYWLFERNPYYWKVDPEGNQLPYIDRLDVTIPVGAPNELVVLKSIAGEIDFQSRGVNLLDIPLVIENQEAGDYRVIIWNNGDYAWPWIMPMYDYPDEDIVDLMYMKEFRQALSHAINRDRINEITSLGMATARQFSLSAESPEFQTEEGAAFYQEWAASYASYDPELAGELLDSIGVVDADGDGWRDRPDGTSLELIVDVPAEDTPTVDRMDLIKEDWDAVGLNTVLNIITWSVVSDRHFSGDIMIRAWGSAAAWGLVSAATVWTPIEGVTYSVGGARIGDYYNSGGERGVAPRPGSMLEQLQDAYTELISIIDPDERNAKLLEAYQIHIDEGPITIGTVGEHPNGLIVKSNFRNVPDFGMTASWDMGFPGTADPEQFFFDMSG
jgi:peptide/nickel transport system substrate-binding protein